MVKDRENPRLQEMTLPNSHEGASYIYTHLCRCALCMCVCIYRCISVHCMCVYMCIRVYVCICTCVYMHVYMYACACVCIWIYVYIHWYGLFRLKVVFDKNKMTLKKLHPWMQNNDVYS